ncbi:MAG: hypothetical protein KF843_07705 [Flavobacteriales bacterium]|nr:hypothetical protein [Flavobacteriales bacterium]
MSATQQAAVKQTLGVRLVGVFLVLSTSVLAATVITLFFPGTAVDGIWAVKPEEYIRLLQHRMMAGAGFLVLVIMMAIAAAGWWRSRRWAWWLVQGILVVNILGDVVRAAGGEVWEGLMGVVLVLALLAYVRSAGVRTVVRR